MSSLQLQKLRISVKAYESELLTGSCNKIIEAVKASDTKVIGPITFASLSFTASIILVHELSKRDDS